MSDDQSARLGLPYLAAGQMQKHVTLNEALTRLDALAQTAVVSRSRADQPDDPADGDLYILPAGATGAAWGGRPAGALMRFEAGGWSAAPAPEGMAAVVIDEAVILAWLDGDWRPLGGTPSELQHLTRLGLGTAADADNPFAAKLGKALWTARGPDEGGDGDLRFTFNKTGAVDVLSLLFQSGWGGRAEIGLIGNDDLSLKVSADGASWRQAMTVQAATGRALFDQGAVRRETTVLAADGGWTPPAWARWVEVSAIGGGGGGGASAQGFAGSRFGGGGGGAGGSVRGLWPAPAVAAGVTAVIGVGGAGGSATGAAGADGGDTHLSLGATRILTAGGGHGGGGGDGVSGAAGPGGRGDVIGNAGGASSVVGAGQTGHALDAVTGAGGGGAGGGLDAANTVHGGGAGGAGATLGVPAAGGTGGDGAAGGPGSAATLVDLSRAGGGGGGGAAAMGVGHAGGDGGGCGAGGGGGGVGVTGFGAGGGGAPGVVILTAIG